MLDPQTIVFLVFSIGLIVYLALDGRWHWRLAHARPARDDPGARIMLRSIAFRSMAWSLDRLFWPVLIALTIYLRQQSGGSEENPEWLSWLLTGIWVAESTITILAVRYFRKKIE